jgi:arabinofuranosyltransferase
MQNDNRARRISQLVIFLAVLFAIVVLVVFPKLTIDDAYITFRYAENLALHGELTYNLGEPHVEGYTGIALPALLAAAMRLGLPPDIVDKTLGILAYFVTALFLFLTGQRLELHPVVTAAMVLLYLTIPVGFTHAVAGLETTMFAASVTVSLWALVRALQIVSGRARSETVLLFAILVCTLIRPEGVVVAGLSVIVLAIDRLRMGKSGLLSLFLRIVVFYAVPLSVYLIWKMNYYGSLLPNSYYVKLADGFDDVSINELKKFWDRYMSFIAIAAALLWLVPAWHYLRRRKPVDDIATKSVDLLVLGFVVLLHVVVLYKYAQSHLWMNYSFRFSTHIYPAFLLAVGILADRGLRTTVHSFPQTSRVAALLVIAAATISLVEVYRHLEHLPGEFRFAAGYVTLLNEEHIPAGHFIRQHVPSDEWLVTVIDAGAIPYYAGNKTVDLGGLNEPVVARKLHSDSAVVDYAFRHQPGAWAITSLSLDSLTYTPAAKRIIDDPRFEQYRLVRRFTTGPGRDYHEFVYLREDLIRSSAP